MLRLTFVRDELSTKMFKFDKILVKIVKFQIQKLHVLKLYHIIYVLVGFVLNTFTGFC